MKQAASRHRSTKLAFGGTHLPLFDSKSKKQTRSAVQLPGDDDVQPDYDRTSSNTSNYTSIPNAMRVAGAMQTTTQYTRTLSGLKEPLTKQDLLLQSYAATNKRRRSSVVKSPVWRPSTVIRRAPPQQRQRRLLQRKDDDNPEAEDKELQTTRRAIIKKFQVQYRKMRRGGGSTPLHVSKYRIGKRLSAEERAKVDALVRQLDESSHLLLSKAQTSEAMKKAVKMCSKLSEIKETFKVGKPLCGGTATWYYRGGVDKFSKDLRSHVESLLKEH